MLLLFCAGYVTQLNSSALNITEAWYQVSQSLLCCYRKMIWNLFSVVDGVHSL